MVKLGFVLGDLLVESDDFHLLALQVVLPIVTFRQRDRTFELAFYLLLEIGKI